MCTGKLALKSPAPSLNTNYVDSNLGVKLTPYTADLLPKIFHTPKD